MMTVKQFVKQVRPGTKIRVGEHEFEVMEHVKWHMLRSDSYYHKYALKAKDGDKDWVIAEDPESGRFILVKKFVLDKPGSYESKYKIEGKIFRFTYGETCVCVEHEGEPLHPVGSYDVWYDYEDGQGGYLSLGTKFPTTEKEDLIGRWVDPSDVSFS